MGLIESILPDIIALTEEQFKVFVEKTVANDYGRNTLARITAQGGGVVAPKPHSHSADKRHRRERGNGARVTG